VRELSYPRLVNVVLHQVNCSNVTNSQRRKELSTFFGMWGPLFAGVPVLPNMSKSASTGLRSIISIAYASCMKTTGTLILSSPPLSALLASLLGHCLPKSSVLFYGYPPMISVIYPPTIMAPFPLPFHIPPWQPFLFFSADSAPCLPLLPLSHYFISLLTNKFAIVIMKDPNTL